MIIFLWEIPFGRGNDYSPFWLWWHEPCPEMNLSQVENTCQQLKKLKRLKNLQGNDLTRGKKGWTASQLSRET
jgi:hypothetical protein